MRSSSETLNTKSGMRLLVESTAEAEYLLPGQRRDAIDEFKIAAVTTGIAVG